MDVSIAICTYNRAGLLDETLARIATQRIPDGVSWEVLVIDNGSTDATSRVIDRHRAGLPLRSFFEPAPGVSHARNRAMLEARGDLLLCTDDDVRVGPGWVEAAIGAAARHPEASVIGGPIAPWFPVEPDPDFIAAFPALRVGYCGLDHDLPQGCLPDHLTVFGANMAFRASALRGLRFDPDLGTCGSAGGIGEETTLIAEIRCRGGVVVWCPTMCVEHYVEPRRMTLSYQKLYLESAGVSNIRMFGVPTGSRWGGAPRWLIRQWFEETVAYWALRLCGARRRALVRARRAWLLTGQIRECRAQARRPAAPASVARKAAAAPCDVGAGTA